MFKDEVEKELNAVKQKKKIIKEEIDTEEELWEKTAKDIEKQLQIEEEESKKEKLLNNKKAYFSAAKQEILLKNNVNLDIAKKYQEEEEKNSMKL